MQPKIDDIFTRKLIAINLSAACLWGSELRRKHFERLGVFERPWQNLPLLWSGFADLQGSSKVSTVP